MLWAKPRTNLDPPPTTLNKPTETPVARTKSRPDSDQIGRLS